MAEVAAWGIGLLLLGVLGVRHATSVIESRREIERFNAARDARTSAPDATAASPATVPASVPPAPRGASPALSVSAPDFSLWSTRAIAAWKAPAPDGAPPLGIFRLARLGLEAPIVEGTTDAALDRGLGHIEDTPRPGEPGNSGIAGHRDSFFRVLKDAVVGDTLDIDTLDGTTTYRIDRIWIVTPEDVEVLDPTPEPAVTLVTCYPFYFVGAAPQRYIVRATRTGPPRSSGTTAALRR